LKKFRRDGRKRGRPERRVGGHKEMHKRGEEKWLTVTSKKALGGESLRL